jgi:hypothetical protein
MTPTLIGRLQTRVFVILVIGLPWTLFLWAFAIDAPLESMVKVLIAMGVIGLGWELLYHWLMGFRWEKDWPSLLGLVTGLNEGLLLWCLLALGAVPGLEVGPSGPQFITHFAGAWILIWLWLQGPMKIFDPRWRFRGGRVV